MILMAKVGGQWFIYTQVQDHILVSTVAPLQHGPRGAAVGPHVAKSAISSKLGPCPNGGQGPKSFGEVPKVSGKLRGSPPKLIFRSKKFVCAESPNGKFSFLSIFGWSPFFQIGLLIFLNISGHSARLCGIAGLPNLSCFFRAPNLLWNKFSKYFLYI